MFSKLSRNSDPKRILVVSQTNIGDVVLTCPVIDILRGRFPKAKMDVVIGPKAISLFRDNPDLTIKVFDKQASLKDKIAWFSDLRRQHYDCVVDLRRTGLALFLMPRYATPLIAPSAQGHKKDMHLNRLRQVYDFADLSQNRYAIQTTTEDEQFFEGAVAPALQNQKFIVIAPGAASSDKRWNPQGFAAVADHLAQQYKIVFVGDANDVRIVEDIQARMKSPALSLAGKIGLRQLALLLKKCAWALVHDSGVMHLACYFNVPVVVLWGPTSLERYAPWSSKSVVIRRNEECPRCQMPDAQVAHNCMSFISPQEVIDGLEKEGFLAIP